MPQASFKHGADQQVEDYTPGSAVALGQVVNVHDRVGIAIRPIAANALGALAFAGVWEVDKVTELAIDHGETVFWDLNGVPANDAESTAGAATTNPEVAISAGGFVMGFAAKAAALDDEKVWVQLQSDPVPGDAA